MHWLQLIKPWSKYVDYSARTDGSNGPRHIHRKLDAAFSRDVPGFAELAKDDRTEFLKRSILTAESKGFKTEQGLASYALAVWWLGLDFESASEELKALLQSHYPEVRKAHAMNEWVHAAIGDPDNIGSADQKLKQALAVTEAWGK